MFGWKAANHRKTERMMDAPGLYAGGATGARSGIIAGTRVATSMGWRDVAALQAGDMVLTFDGGLQEVKAVSRRPLWSGTGPCPAAFRPLLVPAGALDNAEPMMVPPRQGVMLESDLAEEVLGDPFALIPAAALEGRDGIERVFPTDPVEVVGLQFAGDQVVFAERGALLFCPGGEDLLLRAARGPATDCPYRMLPEACAVALAQEAENDEYCRACLEGVASSLYAEDHPARQAA